MSEKEILSKLSEAIVSYNEEDAVRYASELKKMNIDPLEVIEKYLAPAMKTVGDRFERGEYFLSDLMMAGETMTLATRILTANMTEKEKRELGEKQRKTGTMTIGSVKGDIHDIGKDIVATLVRANGVNIHDLGKDVSPKDFAKNAEETSADIIALSALMTTTAPAQADVINFLKEMGVRDRYKIIVGGGVTNIEWSEEIGADGWAPDASSAVTLVKRLLRAE